MTNKPKEICSDPWCRCHDKHAGNGCCGDCRIPNTLSVTLAIGLPDKTWIERTVDVEDRHGFWDDETLNISTVEDAAFEMIPDDEKNKLSPSFWKLIHWEWKG